jgi:serpin B
MEFDKKNTQKADFQKNRKETVEVDMMSLSGEEAKFNYYENDAFQLVELPYKGEDLSMLVFLPDIDTFDDFENNIDAELIAEYQNKLQETEIDLYFPKFTLETEYQMKEDLQVLGMPRVFSTEANLSKMSKSKGKDLYISTIMHKAFVNVNEEGTEAAAATGQVGKITALPQTPVFRADHPFIFVIQHKETNQILFLGKIVDPS